MKVCIDAGHNYSGHDTGAQGNGLREQDITFAIAHKLAYMLKTCGIDVVETRPTLETNLGTDVSSSLQARCDIANNANAICFVSIHCNASADADATGTETIVYQLRTKADQLATKVQEELILSLKTVNRGVKMKSLKVVRSTNMPSILVEVAFISNSSDAKILANKQDQIAMAICKGICEFLGVKEMATMTNKTNAPWYNDAQYWVKENGISDGTRPTEPATRAEVWQMLYKMAQLKK